MVSTTPPAPAPVPAAPLRRPRLSLQPEALARLPAVTVLLPWLLRLLRNQQLIALMPVFRARHQPAVSTALGFAFRAGTGKGSSALFGLAVRRGLSASPLYYYRLNFTTTA